MNSQRNVTELRLLPGEDHTGLLLLEIMAHVDRISACQHLGTKGNPNRCYHCLQNAEHLIQAGARLSSAIRLGALFCKASL